MRYDFVESAQLRSRAKVFTAGLSSACTFGTALTLTGVTIHLFNPTGSGVNLNVIRGVATILTCSISGTLLYCGNAQATTPTGTTPITIQNARLGSVDTPLAKCYSAATLAAIPTELRPMLGVVATAADIMAGFTDYLDGEFSVMPGQVLSIQGLTIVGTGFLGFTWEETPVINP